MTATPTIESLGDAALLVTFGDRIEHDLNARAWAFANAVAAARVDDRALALGAPVTAYASVLVPFDPLALDTEAARAVVGTILSSAAAAVAPPTRAGRILEIPVRYGGDDGPDLVDVAALHGLSEREVVDLHASRTYEVFFLGFAPGFAYLGTLPDPIRTPRLDTPRERVPGGSVGIAAEQTGVYPFGLPGGWRIIGRTDVAPWDPTRDPPALVAPGDHVRFVPER